MIIGVNRIVVSGSDLDSLQSRISLTTLLRNQKSNLEELNLYDNPLDNECSVLLAEALAKNNKLKQSIMGSLHYLQYFKYQHSLESNHTLRRLGVSFDIALGVDSFHLIS